MAAAGGVRGRVVGPLTLVLLAAVLVLAPAVPAAAGECPDPASGDPIRTSAQPEEGHFVFAGRGWGHGVGMSQYGAQGAARLGCSRAEILEHYYQGVSVEPVAPIANNIKVGVAPNRRSGDPVKSYEVTNTGSSAVTWRVVGGDDLEMPRGAVWRVAMEGGAFRVDELDGGNRKPVLDADQGATDIRALVHRAGEEVRLENKRTYARGAVWFAPQDRDAFSVFVRLASMDDYLYGLREVPASWPAAALEAQIVTARSYAYVARGSTYANCDCHIYDSTDDQVYHGTGTEPSSWVKAVDRTTREVLRDGGRTVTAHYSSSHGGHSESARFVWGGDISHEQAVADHRWDRASDNPYRTWSQSLTPQQAGERLGVGILLSIELPDPKGADGRIGDPGRGYGGVVAEGTDGTRTLSGNQARAALGLRSSLFTVAAPPGIASDGDATPLTVSWGHDGPSLPAWYKDGQWALRTPDGEVLRLFYGSGDDVPVVGDWDGDGQDTIGIVRGGTWHLKDDLSGGTSDHSFVYGRVTAGDLALAGDWNGDGADTVGIVRGREWHLRDSLSGGAADRSFVFGRVDRGDAPLIGDWDGDGADTAGVRRDDRWLLRDALAGGPADQDYRYGRAGDRPVVGDWNGDGADTAGIVRGTLWALRNAHRAGAADETTIFDG